MLDIALLSSGSSNLPYVLFQESPAWGRIPKDKESVAAFNPKVFSVTES